MGKDSKDTHRVSVTFSRRQHEDLECLARKHGVKVALVVRRTPKFVIEREQGGPLLPFKLNRPHAQR